MAEDVIVKKILNNNVIIADHSIRGEIVVIGKGIGFGKKENDSINQSQIEKMFILQNEKEKQQYEMLVGTVSEKLIELMDDVIHYIQKEVNKPLNEHIHIALTDHLAFAIKRLKRGLAISNPFLLETKVLYPKEYEIAVESINLINEKLGIKLPEGEVGFVALHIHSALENKAVTEVHGYSRLIAEVTELIEGQLDISINRESIHFLRLARHLLFLFNRFKNGEKMSEPQGMQELLKKEYPVSYSVAWKIIKILEHRFHMKVDEAEILYLTMHIQRLATDKAE